MVREESSVQKSRSFRLKKMLEIPGRQAHSYVLEGKNGGEAIDDKQFRSHSARVAPIELIGSVFNPSGEKGPVSRLSKEGGRGLSPQSKDQQPSDMELMKERFSKLLLGEDMSGGGKGVSSALALSNAITNLAASVFGEQRKLEPMSPDRKARWRKEIDWLLSVTDYIVEFVPSQQKAKDGTNMEIMVTQQRRDLLMNIPALRKLDAMLLDCLDNFRDQNEFWYVSSDADESEKGNQRDDKWWLPTVKVPQDGLSDVSRKWLKFQKESVNQVLKASMAINAQILSEMEIPENYIESLPKNGRSSLGDLVYKSITVEYFNPVEFLSNMDLSTEHKVLDLKNRIEASIVIWKRKMNLKDGKSSWGSGVSMEKRELFEERAETVLLLLKQLFPGLPQSALDISKIQYNRDVGHAILESYSRVLESLANTVKSRIEDVLFADSGSRSPSPMEDPTKPNAAETPTSMTLSDFMGWKLDKGDPEMKKNNTTGNLDNSFKDENEKMSKPPKVVTDKKFSHMDKLEALAGLSPMRI
ncbi:hypothetical protein RHMOL_Rhmol01G0094800 [Rhododendron molle]|uniref:Uncharacterized protein n=1 Tax=Rhododendron molle TaxID=49168 RepID=A0ACC0Q2Z0_RHOML|nr:hypothetical protein RHMOL_Rhmol01G0094800 [Rhododendron molle]